jgi:peptide/nickel transport system substrate-binding protein
MKHKGFGLLTVLVILSTLVAACSSSEVEVTREVEVEVTREVTEIVEQVVTATPEPAAGGGTLTIASTSDIDNYDPHWNQLIAYEVLIGHNVFDYLTKRDADMQIAPALAESWEISDDGTVYTFYLRPGAKFHNGRPLVADDVVFSFNRLVEQETTHATKMEPVASIVALDDHTVQMTLKSPWAPFLEDVAVIAIVPEEAVDTLSEEPVGSGPFRFVEWLPNDRIVLEKNPDYDVPGMPKLDQIVIKVLPDYAVALTNLEAGSVDAVYEVPAADADRFQGRNDIVLQMPEATNSLLLIEMSPLKYEPLQDVRVRKALAMCLDKETIRQNVYFGYGEPQWSSLPRSSWAYIEPGELPYDPEAAKALLAEAGYPDGFELSVKTISGLAVMENLATIWQDGLSKAGVTLNIEIEEVSTWLDHYIARDYQTIVNWMNVHGDPHSMYDIIFKPHLSDPESYPNEEMLALIEEGAVTVDQGRRKAIYAQFQQMAVDEMAPVIIVQSQPLIALSSADVKGWTMNGKGDIFFDSIYMEK